MVGPASDPPDVGIAARPLTFWVASDGRVGIERQALSLALATQALLADQGREAVIAQRIHLKPVPPQVWLPPDLWWDPVGALPVATRGIFDVQLPDVWFGCGRRSIPYARVVKRLSGGQTLVVQAQHPRADLNPFDLVVPPGHDQLSGNNCFPVIGAPTWFEQERIATAQKLLPELFAAPVAGALPRAAVIIGGNAKNLKLTDAVLDELIAMLDGLKACTSAIWISVSRRTPETARLKLRAKAGEIGARFFDNEAQDGPNPYVAFLANCDLAVVTEESTNMVSDALFFGKPVHLFRLGGHAGKFGQFHRTLIDQGLASWWDGQNLAVRPVAPLREASRVAATIVSLLDARRQTSAL